MKTLGWLLHRLIFGFGQATTPGPCTSWAVTSTRDFTSLLIAAVPCRRVRSDRGQPLGVLRVAAGHDVEEGVLDLLGDGAAGALADLDAVEFADGRDFRGGAGEEGLVGDVDLVAGDAFFDQLQAQVLADREDGVAGDAVQGAGR